MVTPGRLIRLASADGAVRGTEPLDYLDPGGRFLQSSTAPHLPVWHGAQPVLIRANPARTEVPGPGGELILPIADGRWLLWQSGQLRLWRTIGEAWRKPIGEPGARALDAQLVLDGRLVRVRAAARRPDQRARWRAPADRRRGQRWRADRAAPAARGQQARDRRAPWPRARALRGSAERDRSPVRQVDPRSGAAERASPSSPSTTACSGSRSPPTTGSSWSGPTPSRRRRPRSQRRTSPAPRASRTTRRHARAPTTRPRRPRAPAGSSRSRSRSRGARRRPGRARGGAPARRPARPARAGLGHADRDPGRDRAGARAAAPAGRRARRRRDRGGVGHRPDQQVRPRAAAVRRRGRRACSRIASGRALEELGSSTDRLRATEEVVRAAERARGERLTPLDVLARDFDLSPIAVDDPVRDRRAAPARRARAPVRHPRERSGAPARSTSTCSGRSSAPSSRSRSRASSTAIARCAGSGSCGSARATARSRR